MDSSSSNSEPFLGACRPGTIWRRLGASNVALLSGSCSLLLVYFYSTAAISRVYIEQIMIYF